MPLRSAVDVVLAVDVGGTKTAAAVVDRDGAVRAIASAPTRAGEGPDAVIATIAGLAASLLDGDPRLRLCGVGIGTAGVVDVATATIVSSTDTFADWPGTPVATLVRAALGHRLAPDAPVTVHNDVDTHAAGEHRYGAAAGASSALVVAVGTGVGAGLIVADAAVRGAHHVAGEIGHLPIQGADHLRCPCGRTGHLEAIGSGLGLHAHYRWLGGDPTATDTRAVANRAAAGDPVAARAIADSAAAVGRALAGAATLLDPELIVVTGGVPQIGDAWWQPMADAYRREVIAPLLRTRLLAGVLGNDAPLRGAASAAWDAQKDV